MKDVYKIRNLILNMNIYEWIIETLIDDNYSCLYI